MTRPDLQTELKKIINAKRVYRDRAAKFVLENPDTFEELVITVLNPKSGIRDRAAWTFELACIQNPELLFPYMDLFCDGLKNLQDDRVIRPISKICNLMIQQSCKNELFNLTKKQKEQIIEVSFDWLIDDKKTAAQAFSMNSIFRLRNEFPWIPESLFEHLTNNIMLKSPGYQNQAKKILNKLSQEKGKSSFKR